MLLQLLLLAICIIAYLRLDWLSKRIHSNKKHSLYQITLITSFSILLIVIYWIDFRNVGILIYTIGSILNNLVRVLNDGLMPVDLESTRIACRLKSIEEARAKIEKTYILKRKHVIMSNSTRFNFLGDYLGRSVESIGDRFIDAGGKIIIYSYIGLFIYYIANFIS